MTFNSSANVCPLAVVDCRSASTRPAGKSMSVIDVVNGNELVVGLPYVVPLFVKCVATGDAVITALYPDD